MMFNSKIKRGLSISSSQLSWVEIDSSSSSKPDIKISANESLPEGLVKPFFAKRNIDDREAFKFAIEKLIPGGHMTGDIALSIPDHIAKITSLKFDDLPDSRQEVEQLILWRMKKTVPLPVADIKLDFISYKANDGTVDVAASVASRLVLREYEDVLKEMGLRPRLVDIASINTLRAFETAIPESSLFIELSEDSLGMAILDEGRLGFFRSKEVEGSSDKVLSDKVKREIVSTLAYLRTTFPEKEIATICFHSTIPGLEEIIKGLEAGFEGSIVNLSVSDYISEAEAGSDNIDEHLAPAIGGALRL
ncbi:MAG: pilus assembly protein PilM [bacterium]|nr:pilus assembly protein PilM [bacterium]